MTLARSNTANGANHKPNKMTVLATLTEQEQEQVEALERMIKSCFTYGGVDKDSYNFQKYILPHKHTMDERLFNLIYTQTKTELENEYTVKKNVYTDSEGLTYNTLIKNN